MSLSKPDTTKAETDYERGFAAGFKLAWEQVHGTGPISILTPFFPQQTPGCLVCHMKFEGAMGYVCTHPNCPSAVRCS